MTESLSPAEAVFSPLAGIVKGKTKRPPRLLIYGTEGIGKSSLAANAQDAIFVPTEDGLDQIECERFPVAEKFSQFQSNLQSLLETQHDYKFIVIDSADWLERLIHIKTCEDSGVSNIEKAAGGYGKGYFAALDYWREILAMLDYARTLGIGSILLAHADIQKFDDPEQQSYDRYSPRLHKKTSGPLVSEWADAILFATRKMRLSKVEEPKSKDKFARVIAAPIGANGGDRIVRCVGGPACVAKNRYGMPDELPLSWNEIYQYMI